MVSEGAILGNTAHIASGRTRTRETMDLVRKQNPEAYYRVVARVGQRLADRVGLLSDTSFGVSASRPLLAPRTERDLLGCREVPGRAYFGVQTLRAVENFAISGVALRDFSRFIDAFAFVKKAAALANTELGVLGEDKRDAIAQACDEITAGRLHDQFVVDMVQGGAGTSTNMNVNEVSLTVLWRSSGTSAGSTRICTPTTTSTARSRPTTPTRRRSSSASSSPAVTRSPRWRSCRPGCASRANSSRTSSRWAERSCMTPCR